MTMPVQFPNSSRCFDATRRAVRFWGSDGALETTFFVTEGALQRIAPGTATGESELLRVFDTHVDQIHRAATRIYVRGSRGSYDLDGSDF
jgi:hypothetical protein